MGHKSTTKLTRERAISRYADFKAEIKRRKWEAQAMAMSDEELGNALDRLSDEAYDARHGGSDGGFENFLILHPDHIDQD